MGKQSMGNENMNDAPVIQFTGLRLIQKDCKKIHRLG